jgi:hypothetical protein
MLSFGGDGPDRKRATFRVMGPALDPDKITRATGLAPDEAHRRGDPRRRGDPFREGLWSVRSSPPMPQLGNHLEDHLCWLLDRVEPHAEQLRRICEQDRLRVDFYCGYTMCQTNSGLELTAAMLARIAALGASLGLDIYGANIETELEHWTCQARPE